MTLVAEAPNTFLETKKTSLEIDEVTSKSGRKINQIMNRLFLVNRIQENYLGGKKGVQEMKEKDPEQYRKIDDNCFTLLGFYEETWNDIREEKIIQNFESIRAYIESNYGKDGHFLTYPISFNTYCEYFWQNSFHSD